MNTIIHSILSVALTMNVSAQDEPSRPLMVVPSVDLERYCGTWYEIVRLPNRFQNDCAGDITATYTLLDDGEIKVVNRCRSAKGELTEVEGRARRASKETPNSMLKVRFAPAILSFLPFVWGDYWVIELGSDYSYVVIGEPDRRYLWVLARSPNMNEALLTGILDRAKGQGYDITGLIRTKQTQ